MFSGFKRLWEGGGRMNVISPLVCVCCRFGGTKREIEGMCVYRTDLALRIYEFKINAKLSVSERKSV